MPNAALHPGGNMSDLSIARRSILVVDDEAESRLLLEQSLPEHRVVFARNAFEALRSMNAEPFDGYVLEYWQPDLSGPALCREIRKVDLHAPVVFCSAAAKEGHRRRGLRAGANAYLFKPINPEELRSQLGVHLTLALIQSLRAKIEEERAAQDELKRQIEHARHRIVNAKQLVASSLERMARARAYKAFIDARGTRAHFENWWPHVYAAAQANKQIRQDSVEEPAARI
jgi:DNA-binding response OmpR family regulator